MRTRSRRIMSVSCILLLGSTCFAETSGSRLRPGPTREELAIVPTGPLIMSPWRAAAQKAERANSDVNHYLYSAPPPFYFGYGLGGFGLGGWGWGFGAGVDTHFGRYNGWTGHNARSYLP